MRQNASEKVAMPLKGCAEATIKSCNEMKNLTLFILTEIVRTEPQGLCDVLRKNMNERETPVCVKENNIFGIMRS